MSPGLTALYLALALLAFAAVLGSRRRGVRARQSRQEWVALYHVPGRGHVLRIGISNNPGRREDEYAARAWWWSQRTGPLTVRRWYPTRQAALAAERLAIRREAPLYNDQHNLGRHHASPVLARPAASDPACRPLRPGRLGDVRGLRVGRQPARQGSHQAR